jgi:transposase InsO family protein
MNDVYKIAGISRQYHHKAEKKGLEDALLWQRLMEMVVEMRKEYPRSSARKIHKKLRINEVGINRFEQYVSLQGLSVKRQRSFIKTTHPGPVCYPNLVNGLEIDDTNQLWVSDITYFITDHTTFYIVILLDVYSRRIIGYSCSDNLLAVNNQKALKMAFELRGQKEYDNLIHHSDKGSQYGANCYTKMLNDAEIEISMCNNCLENPYAERINGIIKNDYLIAYKINTLADLQRAMRKSVMLYNNYPHGKLLHQQSPMEFEENLRRNSGQSHEIMKLYDFRK